jgi:hypothetical protein
MTGMVSLYIKKNNRCGRSYYAVLWLSMRLTVGRTTALSLLVAVLGGKEVRPTTKDTPTLMTARLGNRSAVCTRVRQLHAGLPYVKAPWGISASCTAPRSHNHHFLLGAARKSCVDHIACLCRERSVSRDSLQASVQITTEASAAAAIIACSSAGGICAHGGLHRTHRNESKWRTALCLPYAELTDSVFDATGGFDWREDSINHVKYISARQTPPSVIRSAHCYFAKMTAGGNKEVGTLDALFEHVLTHYRYGCFFVNYSGQPALV